MGLAGRVALVAATIWLAQGSVYAQIIPESCQPEFIPLMQKRQAAIQRVNNFKPKSTTAAQACSGFKDLAARNKALLDYMTKNKDWCQFNDEQMNGISSAQENIDKSRASTCDAAAKQAAQIKQMRRQQQQQGSGQAGVGSGVRLPQGAL